MSYNNSPWENPAQTWGNRGRPWQRFSNVQGRGSGNVSGGRGNQSNWPRNSNYNPKWNNVKHYNNHRGHGRGYWQKPYTQQHFNIPPPKPPSPLPGTEEYTQRNIQQTSELIKKQLYIGGNYIDEEEMNEQEPEMSYNNTKVNTENSPQNNHLKTVKKVKTINVKEVHDKIIRHISNMSLSQKINFVERGSSEYDRLIREIQMQKRLELSRTLRNMSNNFEHRSADCDVINSIIPDIGIRIEDLPKEFIEQLSSTLNMDFDCLGINDSQDNETIDPLDFEYLNTPINKATLDSNYCSQILEMTNFDTNQSYLNISNESAVMQQSKSLDEEEEAKKIKNLMEEQEEAKLKEKEKLEKLKEEEKLKKMKEEEKLKKLKEEEKLKKNQEEENLKKNKEEEAMARMKKRSNEDKVKMNTIIDEEISPPIDLAAQKNEYKFRISHFMDSINKDIDDNVVPPTTFNEEQNSYEKKSFQNEKCNSRFQPKGFRAFRKDSNNEWHNQQDNQNRQYKRDRSNDWQDHKNTRRDKCKNWKNRNDQKRNPDNNQRNRTKYEQNKHNRTLEEEKCKPSKNSDDQSKIASESKSSEKIDIQKRSDDESKFIEKSISEEANKNAVPIIKEIMIEDGIVKNTPGKIRSFKIPKLSDRKERKDTVIKGSEIEQSSEKKVENWFEKNVDQLTSKHKKKRKKSKWDHNECKTETSVEEPIKVEQINTETEISINTVENTLTETDDKINEISNYDDTFDGDYGHFDDDSLDGDKFIIKDSISLIVDQLDEDHKMESKLKETDEQSMKEILEKCETKMDQAQHETVTNMDKLSSSNEKVQNNDNSPLSQNLENDNDLLIDQKNSMPDKLEILQKEQEVCKEAKDEHFDNTMKEHDSQDLKELIDNSIENKSIAENIALQLSPTKSEETINEFHKESLTLTKQPSNLPANLITETHEETINETLKKENTGNEIIEDKISTSEKVESDDNLLNIDQTSSSLVELSVLPLEDIKCEERLLQVTSPRKLWRSPGEKKLLPMDLPNIETQNTSLENEEEELQIAIFGEDCASENVHVSEEENGRIVLKIKLNKKNLFKENKDMENLGKVQKYIARILKKVSESGNDDNNFSIVDKIKMKRLNRAMPKSMKMKLQRELEEEEQLHHIPDKSLFSDSTVYQKVILNKLKNTDQELKRLEVSQVKMQEDLRIIHEETVKLFQFREKLHQELLGNLIDQPAEETSPPKVAEKPNFKRKRKMKLASVNIEECIDTVMNDFTEDLKTMGYGKVEAAQTEKQSIENSKYPECSKRLVVRLVKQDLNKLKEQLYKINDCCEINFDGWDGSILVIKVVNDIVVAGNDKGVLYFYNINAPKLLKSLSLASKAIASIFAVFKQSQTILYIGSLDGTLSAVNLDTYEVLSTVNVDDSILCMESAWGYIFCGSQSGNLIRFNIKKNKVEDTITISEKDLLVLKATQEGARRVLLLATRNSPVSVRDAMSGLLMRTMEGMINPTVYTMLLHNNKVYCGTSQHDVLVYTFQDGQLIHKHEQSNTSGVVCMTIINNLLFVGCYNGNIYAYNTKTMEFITSFSGPGGLFLSMEVTNKRIIAGTKQNKFMSWALPECVLNQISY